MKSVVSGTLLAVACFEGEKRDLNPIKMLWL